jgi:DNA-binding response OmpR family regulator
MRRRLRAPSLVLAREGAADAQAAARPAVRFDVAACGRNDVLDDGEAEARAARGASRVRAVEALEEPVQVRVVHTRAVVGGCHHCELARALHRDREPRPVARVANRVLREVLRDHAQHARPQGHVDVRVALDVELDARALGGAGQATRDVLQHRQCGGVPERHDLLAALELREEEHLVDQGSGVLDLCLRLLDQIADVGAGQVGQVEQSEDPRKRRPQLMRDRSREAGAKLVEAAVIHQIVTIPKPGQNPPPVYGRRVAKILIVEDDNVIADGMAKHLVAAGFDPIVVGRGELGLARLRFESPDVCVLDLMLPELDGWKLIETARAEGIGTPIVVVSARGTEHDRVHALEIGADDYLVKPFSMRELVARVGAAARRGVRPQEERRGEAIEIEELRIDPREVQAFVDGKSAELTPTEFKLLYTLALDRGRVVTRDELLQKVWGRRETHRDRTVDVFVRRLRQKIDRNASQHSFIQTRFGVGYKLEPELKI